MPDKDSLSLEKDTPSSPSVADRESGMQGEEPVSILHLALYFLKIGAIGFGGGMAVIALIERECVRRRCVEAEEFLHGVGWCFRIPVLVTRPQLLLTKALAHDFEHDGTDDINLQCNMLQHIGL
jgi:hypothetical protein